MTSAASAAPPDNATSISFSAVGDFASSTNFDAVLTKMAAEAPDLNLALGDFSYGTTGQEQAWCDQVTAKVGNGFPFELISGNHESNGLNGNINDFSSCLPNQLSGAVGTYGREYYVDVPERNPLVRFVMISPSLGFPNVGQYSYAAGTSHYTWTAAAIDGARTKGVPWVVVGMHKPCLSVGEYACDPGADLVNLLLDRKVDLVLSGHEHLYQRTKQLGLGAGCTGLTIGSFNASCVKDSDNSVGSGNGTVFATVGTGGIALRDVDAADPEAPYFAATSGANQNPTWGFLDVDANATTLSARFVPASGGTFSDAFTINKGAAPPDSPPVARFTSSTNQLTASFDGATSSDADGPVTYAWAFGDGGTGTGVAPTHSYTAAGTYDVGLTVTDSAGSTDTVTRAVTVSAAPAQVVLASDDFARTLTSGWGTADTGGGWTVGGAAASSGVSAGTGRLTVPTAGTEIPASLRSVSSSNADLLAQVSADKVPIGTGARLDLSFLARRVQSVGDYRSRVRVLAGGGVRVGLSRTDSAGIQVVLGSEVVVPGLTYAPGTPLMVRTQAVGTSPTTIRVKAWLATTSEPSTWMVTSSDNTANLQVKGGVGMYSYLTSAATNAPVEVRYDNLRAVVP